MPVDLHYSLLCPHARIALIVAKHLNIDANFIEVDLPGGGTRTPDYLKINPNHTVPTLVDNDFILFESRAIAKYLVDKFSPGNSLYPVDLQARASVDKILLFEATSYYQALKNAFYPKGKQPTKEELDELEDKVNILDRLLGEEAFFTGPNVTLADIALSASVPQARKYYPQLWTNKLDKWYQRVIEVLPVVEQINGGNLIK